MGWLDSGGGASEEDLPFEQQRQFDLDALRDEARDPNEPTMGDLQRFLHDGCRCCGRTYPPTDARVSSGPIHFDCWEEHHSDPSGTWPPGHSCTVERG